jgi:hypothetical protein
VKKNNDDRSNKGALAQQEKGLQFAIPDLIIKCGGAVSCTRVPLCW